MIRSIIAMGRWVSRSLVKALRMSTNLTLRDLGSDEVQGYAFGRPEIAVKTPERVLREYLSPFLQLVWSAERAELSKTSPDRLCLEPKRVADTDRE